MRINADGINYRQLNEQIHAAIAQGQHEFVLDNVRGQRYIAAGLDNRIRITINGVPGNDLAAFMNGAELTVHANGQDGVGNTMNAGRIVIHGDAGDIVGHSMRGGRIFVRGHVGYRTGIHMKAYQDHFPVVVVGGRAGDYLGEYMAGGVLVVLGQQDGKDASPVGEYVGTGMHGGTIFLRGRLEPFQCGKEVATAPLDDADWEVLSGILTEYCPHFGLSAESFPRTDFVKLFPKSSRPYGNLYAY